MMKLSLKTLTFIFSFMICAAAVAAEARTMGELRDTLIKLLPVNKSYSGEDQNGVGASLDFTENLPAKILTFKWENNEDDDVHVVNIKLAEGIHVLPKNDILFKRGYTEQLYFSLNEVPHKILIARFGNELYFRLDNKVLMTRIKE